MEDKIIELADYFISESKTYREAKIACEKLLKQVTHEIELRALESETRVFILTILTNMLITFIFLNLYSRYLAKELKKIEDRVLVYLQLKTMLQKDSPSSVKE